VQSLKKLHYSLAAALVAAALGGCSQSSLEPPITKINPINSSTLQFAAGTANIAGTVGLNVVETFRQTGSHVGTSILSNAPTIIGPAGFLVPTTPDAGTDGGTNSITGQISTNVNQAPPSTTFSFTGLASASGINPSQLNNASSLPGFLPYSLPFYAANNAVLSAAPANAAPCGAALPNGTPGTPPSTPLSAPEQLCYDGGPPAFVPAGHTSEQDGTFPGGDPGFVLGFDTFAATPVSGTYTLNVLVPTGLSTNNVPSFATKTATSVVSASTVLPAWTTPPSFVSDGTGGGTVTTNFAGGGTVTEEYIEVVNLGPGACQLSGAAPYYYTFKVTPGTPTVTIPDSIGAAPPKQAQPHTLCTAADDGAATGDVVAVYGFAVDYPLFAAAFPQSNGVAAPAIVGTAGQDDITTSAASPTGVTE